MLKYAGTEINFTVERLVDIVTKVIDGLIEDDKESAMIYLTEEVEMNDYEMKFLADLVQDKHGNWHKTYEDEHGEYYDTEYDDDFDNYDYDYEEEYDEC